MAALSRARRLPQSLPAASSTNNRKRNAETQRTQRRSLRGRLPLLKHAQDPESSDAGGQMFECVSANDVAQRENLAVREFCNFCAHLKTGHNEQIRPARVARREQQHHEEREHGIKLRGAEETQI